MKLETFTKQPSEFKDYDIDYAPWLTPIDDTIDDVKVVIECVTDPDESPVALVLDKEPEYTVNYLKLWFSGGTAGFKYKVTIQVTTVVGRIDESELIFKIKDY